MQTFFDSLAFFLGKLLNLKTEVFISWRHTLTQSDIETTFCSAEQKIKQRIR